MEKHSSKKGKSRVLQGLIFFKHCTAKTYLSILEWHKAGTPDNASIFDSADALLACGIPICDGAPIRGMFRRVPPIPGRKCLVQMPKHLVCPLELAEAKTTEKGINVAETKDHHAMIY